MFRPLATFALICSTATLSAQTAPTADEEPLRQFEGNYLFYGTDAHCDAVACRPNNYYECSIQAVGQELRLTGFVGYVDSREQPYFKGTYNPDEQTIYFCCGPEADGENIYDEYNNRYFVYDFTLNVGADAEGRLTLSWPGPFWFYASHRDAWPRASYSSLTFTKDAPLPVWNGNINHLNPDPSTLDDLLTYTIEFENAHKVVAADTDIQGYIFSEDGQLYALAMVDGVIDAIGSLTIHESRATIHFARISDFEVDDADSRPLAGQNKRPATPGQATVIFRKNSFCVDGQVIKQEIIKTFNLK